MSQTNQSNKSHNYRLFKILNIFKNKIKYSFKILRKNCSQIFIVYYTVNKVVTANFQFQNPLFYCIGFCTIINDKGLNRLFIKALKSKKVFKFEQKQHII